MGIEWTSCSLGGAAAGATGPPDLADSKRDHPAGCAWTMFVCLQNGEGGDAKRIIQVTFSTAVGLFALLIFGSRWEGGSRGQIALLSERVKWQLAMPTVPLFGQQAQGWVIPFSIFPGTILYKDWGGHEECLFRACLCLTVSSAPVLGTPNPSQVSFLGTKQRKEVLWGPSSDHISGECFHLPNPSPMICPQRGTKGPLIAQIEPQFLHAPGKGCLASLVL